MPTEPLFDTSSWYPGWEWVVAYVIILLSIGVTCVLMTLLDRLVMWYHEWRYQVRSRERMQ